MKIMMVLINDPESAISLLNATNLFRPKYNSSKLDSEKFCVT